MIKGIPLFGRLSLEDYMRVTIAISILFMEPLFRLLFFVFPLKPMKWIATTIFDLFGNMGLYRLFGYAKTNDKSETFYEKFILELNTTQELVKYHGFPFQTHYVTTKDGYILTLHRIPGSRAEKLDQQRNKPVVILWHGLMMCSEGWVASTSVEGSLAFTLAEAGYDGNI